MVFERRRVFCFSLEIQMYIFSLSQYLHYDDRIQFLRAVNERGREKDLCTYIESEGAFVKYKFIFGDKYVELCKMFLRYVYWTIYMSKNDVFVSHVSIIL